MACCSVDVTLTNLVFLCVLVFGVKKLIQYYKKWRLEKMLEKWDNTPKDKVILHTLWRCKHMPSISPFGLKLETYLRMAKIPYELETKDIVGPKGKFPWISLNGMHIADSHLIIQFLNKKFSVDLNKNATDEQQVATAKTCRIMLENHFLWGIVQYRFIENSENLGQQLRIPTLLKILLPLRVGSFKKRMINQGMGRHTPTEIYQMTEDDLRTLSTILGSKKFIAGDVPCEEDAGVFGVAAQALWGSPGSKFEKLVNGELTNLKEYCERMKQEYWPDWDDCTDRL